MISRFASTTFFACDVVGLVVLNVHVVGLAASRHSTAEPVAYFTKSTRFMILGYASHPFYDVPCVPSIPPYRCGFAVMAVAFQLAIPIIEIPLWM